MALDVFIIPMKIIIVTCLLTLSVWGVNNACKNSEDFREFYSMELGDKHKSLFSFIDSKIGSKASGVPSKSFFKLDFGKQVYNAIIYVKEASNGSHELLKHALLEAKVISEFLEFEGVQFGYLSPKFIDCEYGTEVSSISGKTYNYVIILTDYLQQTFDISKTVDNSAIKEMAKKIPLDRLVVYLKIARSLENAHMLGIFHGKLEPSSIASDLDFNTPKIIGYSKSRFTSVEADQKLDNAFETDEMKIDPTSVNSDFFIQDLRALVFSFAQIECAISGISNQMKTDPDFNYGELYTKKEVDRKIITATESLSKCFEESLIDKLEGFSDLVKSMMQSFNHDTNELRYSSSKLANDFLVAIRKNNKDYAEPFYLNEESVGEPLNLIEDKNLLEELKKNKIPLYGVEAKKIL